MHLRFTSELRLSKYQYSGKRWKMQGTSIRVHPSNPPRDNKIDCYSLNVTLGTLESQYSPLTISSRFLLSHTKQRTDRTFYLQVCTKTETCSLKTCLKDRHLNGTGKIKVHNSIYFFSLFHKLFWSHFPKEATVTFYHGQIQLETKYMTNLCFNSKNRPLPISHNRVKIRQKCQGVDHFEIEHKTC